MFESVSESKASTYNIIDLVSVVLFISQLCKTLVYSYIACNINVGQMYVFEQVLESR